MMIKPIDMSVLPDGFLIEARVFMQGINNNYSAWQLNFKDSNDPVISNRSRAYRPALNFWHHNDGTMTLPDGLVVETMEYHCDKADVAMIHGGLVHFYDLRGLDGGWADCDTNDLSEMCAVKILGVTSEYGAQLGMEVIEL